MILEAGDKGDLEMLECIYHGGIKNLNDYVNIDERNVAHMAIFTGSVNIIKFLKINAHFDFSYRDRWTHTSLDDAIRIKNKQYEIPNLQNIMQNLE